ncbi:MAG TPA: acyl-CoA dehydrogenase family protein [Candidatus Kapabacteria bacterium]|nr:acyl-CoA dehydrogenase family protein [Candidatus Kapabacteria bacterium]
MYRNLDDEHNQLRNTVRKFAEEVIKPVAKDLDEKEEFSYEMTSQLADMGFLGATIPEEYGGSNLDYLSYLILVEELARVDSSQAITVAAHNSLGIGPILNFGNEHQKETILPKLVNNLWGFGLTEPDAGSDAGNTKTRAYQVGEDWVINGSKIFITNASTNITLGSSVLTVTGQQSDGKKEYTTFILYNDTPGFEAREMKGKMLWRSSNTSELYFNECKVPSENILGNIGDGFKQMLATLDKGRLSIAAMSLGLAQGAYELALEYAKQRKTFGRSISTYQTTAFKLADLEAGLEIGRTYLYDIVNMLNKGEKITKEGAIAKLYCSELAHKAADHCVQIHGGYGLMREYAAERFYRDQKILEIGEGTSEIQRLVIARMIGCYDN